MRANKWMYGIFVFIIPLCFTLFVLWFIYFLRVQDVQTSAAARKEEHPSQVELTFWNTWIHNEKWEQAMYERISAFKKEHPEVNIRITSIPHDEYKIKVKAAAAGRELPDMLVVWPGAELQPLVAGKTLLPINDVADVYRNKLIPADKLLDYAVNGKQYAIPTVVSFTSIIYYNHDLLESLGYSTFPSTYDEFKQMIGKIRARGIVPIALGDKGRWVLQSCYLSTIASRFTGDDFLRQALQGNRKFTDPDFVSALNVLRELNAMGAFNDDKNNLDDMAQQDLFISGKSAMVISGSWALAHIAEKYPPDRRLGIAVFPSVSSGKGLPGTVSGITGQGIALNANLSEEQLTVAKAFLQTITSEATYKRLLQLQTLVPAKMEVPTYTDETFKTLVQLTSRGLSPVYDGVLPTDLTDNLNQQLQEMTTSGQLTAKQVADRLQNKLDEKRKAQVSSEWMQGADRR